MRKQKVEKISRIEVEMLKNKIKKNKIGRIKKEFAQHSFNF